MSMDESPASGDPDEFAHTIQGLSGSYDNGGPPAPIAPASRPAGT